MFFHSTSLSCEQAPMACGALQESAPSWLAALEPGKNPQSEEIRSGDVKAKKNVGGG